MADAVAGLGIDDAVFLRDRLQKVMVVGVLKTYLKGVVVNVRNRYVRLYAIYSHRLELEIRHRTCSVLCQSLIDTDT